MRASARRSSTRVIDDIEALIGLCRCKVEGTHSLVCAKPRWVDQVAVK